MSHYIAVKTNMTSFLTNFFNQSGKKRLVLPYIISSPNKNNTYMGRRKNDLLTLYKLIANKK